MPIMSKTEKIYKQQLPEENHAKLIYCWYPTKRERLNHILRSSLRDPENPEYWQKVKQIIQKM